VSGRAEVLIAGFGGQGVVLAATILGRAVALHEGRHAVQIQSYGPEARGGACSSSVVVSDRPVDYPYARRPDVMVLMSRAAADKYLPMAGPRTTVLYEEALVPRPAVEGPVHGIPAVRIAERLGARMAANVVMLGFLAGRSAVVSPEALKRAVLEAVPAKSRALNEKAFLEGRSHGQPLEVHA
jgi:2-oxoglutarate ferredoxin oxidoreductase subunit gamma